MCRWRVDVKSWWDWCQYWRAMLSMIAGRDGLLAGLSHWQLIPFFYWIVFCLRLPPCRSLVVDLGQLQCGSENDHSCRLVIFLKGLVEVFTYWSSVQDSMSSPKREVKHKVVNLILVYLFTKNAFYKIDNITYKCELIHK